MQVETGATLESGRQRQRPGGNDPVIERLWGELTAAAPAVLRLTGNDADAAATVDLEGPFTVEAWINLESPIGNQDSLLAADPLPITGKLWNVPGNGFERLCVRDTSAG